MPDSVAVDRASLELEWTGDHLLRIDDVEFFLTVGLDELHAHESRTNHFLLGKTRPMVDAVLACARPRISAASSTSASSRAAARRST